MKKLLSKGDTNAKTAKNLRDTLILYLAPFTQNSKGINLCPKASAGCADKCLFTAGMGIFPNVIEARKARTEFFLGDRKAFLEQIASEINAKAKRQPAFQPLAVRLNGTSDVKLVEMMTSEHQIHPNVVFYDYTKIPSKAGRKTLPSGHDYVVTFSRSEVNEADAIKHLERGNLVAVVFSGELPTEWNGYPVYDGDERDDLMLDIKGAGVLGLKAKGKARKDDSGFVVVS